MEVLQKVKQFNRLFSEPGHIYPGSKCSPTVGVAVRVGGVDKNFNLDHNFQTRSDRPFILHMCIPCDKTFHMVP